MNCYRTSNNKFFTAPPRMADGRHFTDYRPNCHVNNMMRNNNEIYNSFDYRLFLSRNADNIMDANRKHAHLKNAVTKCKQPYETGTMLPEQDRVLCDKHNCKVIENNKNGGSSSPVQQKGRLVLCFSCHLRREWPKSGCCTGQECAVLKSRMTYDASAKVFKK